MRYLVRPLKYIPKKELYILHHTGMGDHFTCNGIIRHYAEKCEKIYLFFKDPNKENVRYLYKDLKNVDFIDSGIHEDNLAELWYLSHPECPFLLIGHSNLAFYPNINFDEVFYINANLPFAYKWEKFHIERDMKREQEVYYDVLGLKDNEEYFFVHDIDSCRIKNIDKNVKIIKPDNKDIRIHEFLYVIEKAKEIHLMMSSFISLIDLMGFNHDKMFYHEYVRGPIGMSLISNWYKIDHKNSQFNC